MKLVSTKTELSVLKGITSTNLVIGGSLLSGVDQSYFFNDYVKEAYEHILSINRQTGRIPSWSALVEDTELDEEVRLKLKKLKPKGPTNKAEVVEALRVLNSYRQLRGIYQINEKSFNALRSQKIKPLDLINKMAEELIRLQSGKDSAQAFTTFGTGNSSVKVIKELLNPGKMNYLPTGFSDFDKENQGYTNGSLVTLGGTSGGGKSAVASQLAINWSRMGEDVVLVPLEMSELEMSARIMANVSGIDVRKILFDKMSRQERKSFIRSYKAFIAELKKAGGSYSIYKPKHDITIEEVMAAVYPRNPRVVIVDYISLLKGVSGDDSWQKLGDVARYCKVWAETHNKIVVLLAQVNEEGKIRYAGAIKEHSSYAWTFVSTKQTRENEIITFDQIKARNGRLFEFSVKALLDTMRISDLEIEDREKVNTEKRSSKGKKKEAYLSDVAEAEDDD